MEALMRYAISQGAGFETTSRFVSWVFENYTNEEMDSRSVVDLWAHFFKLELLGR